jgi:hypothetical protein
MFKRLTMTLHDEGFVLEFSALPLPDHAKTGAMRITDPNGRVKILPVDDYVPLWRVAIGEYHEYGIRVWWTPEFGLWYLFEQPESESVMERPADNGSLTFGTTSVYFQLDGSPLPA